MNPAMYPDASWALHPPAAPRADRGDSAAAAHLFRMALILRVVVALLLHFAVANDELFAPDQITYHSRGLMLARSWSAEGALPASYILPTGPVAYFYIVAALYYVFGPISLAPKLLNCLIGALCVPLVRDIALRMGAKPVAALRAARFVTWFPSLVLWSALNIRDAWVVLLILIIARESLDLQERPRVTSLLLLGCGLLALAQFRAYVLLPVAIPVVLSMVVQRSRNLIRNLILGCAVALVLIYADQAAGANRRLRMPDLEELQQQRDFNMFDAASRFEQADISTPTRALMFLPKGLAYFLLAPFPWSLGSIRQVLALPETLYFYWLLPWVFRGAKDLLSTEFRRSLMAVLITASLTVGYALGEGNAGTAYRHRAQILGFFLIFAAVGLERRLRAGPAAPSVARP